MHLHLRIHHWVIWWIYWGVLCGVVAVVNIVLRRLTRDQEAFLIIFGVLYWAFGGLVCWAYEGIELEKPFSLGWDSPRKGKLRGQEMDQ